MSGEMKAIKAVVVAATIVSSLTVPAYPQGLGSIANRTKAPAGGALAEKRAPIDEKAYEAALGRIPEPKQKYDPWGVARPSEPAKAAKKSNQGCCGE
jgi:hypothetical protein